jgi:hypothetical protein
MTAAPVSAVDPQLIKVGLQFLDRAPTTGIGEARALGQVAVVLEEILSGQLVIVAASAEPEISDDEAAARDFRFKRGPPGA